MATQTVVAKVTDTNLTETLNVIDGLDMGMAPLIQGWLSPLYSSKYGEFFQQNIFDVPLANLILAILVFLFIMGLRKVFTLFILRFFRLLVRKTKTDIDDKFLKAIKGPLKFLFIIGGVYFFFYFLCRLVLYLTQEK